MALVWLFVLLVGTRAAWFAPGQFVKHAKMDLNLRVHRHHLDALKELETRHGMKFMLRGGLGRATAGEVEQYRDLLDHLNGKHTDSSVSGAVVKERASGDTGTADMPRIVAQIKAAGASQVNELAAELKEANVKEQQTPKQQAAKDNAANVELARVKAELARTMSQVNELAAELKEANVKEQQTPRQQAAKGNAAEDNAANAELARVKAELARAKAEPARPKLSAYKAPAKDGLQACLEGPYVLDTRGHSEGIGSAWSWYACAMPLCLITRKWLSIARHS